MTDKLYVFEKFKLIDFSKICDYNLDCTCKVLSIVLGTFAYKGDAVNSSYILVMQF